MTTDNTAVIRQLEREVELLREENNALRCQVERLRQSGNRVIHYGEPKSDWDNTVVECLKGQCTAAVRADAVDEALRNYAAQWREPQVHGPFTRELVHDDIIDHADRLAELRGETDNE